MLLATDEMKIVAGRIFDSENAEFISNQIITVSNKTGLIQRVQPLSEDPHLNFSSSDVIDLRGQTVLPGFIDTHVHRQFIAVIFRDHTILISGFSLPSSVCRNVLERSEYSGDYR